MMACGEFDDIEQPDGIILELEPLRRVLEPLSRLK